MSTPECPEKCPHCGAERIHPDVNEFALYICGARQHLSKESRHYLQWYRSENCWRGEAAALRARLEAYPADWLKDSSLETWFPLTAKELERAHEGEKWLSEMLCVITATAISGMAAAAVITDGPFTAEHTLSVVQCLAGHAKDLQVKLAQARAGLEAVAQYQPKQDWLATDASILAEIAREALGRTGEGCSF